MTNNVGAPQVELQWKYDELLKEHKMMKANNLSMVGKIAVLEHQLAQFEAAAATTS